MNGYPHMSVSSIGRRRFMLGAGGLTFGVITGLGETLLSPQAEATPAKTALLSPWVTIASDGVISIMAAATELGQGTRTHQPLVLAEELDADWNDVCIVSAPPNDKIYGNPTIGGIMYTNAARTMSGYFPLMRTFGAQVRCVLLDNVAKHWNVPVEELTTGPSVVIHEKSKRRIAYGKIVGFLEMPAAGPEIHPDQLKKPADFRYLGKDIMRADLPSKTRGQAIYGIDVQRPGMLYGAVLRAPVQGAGPAEVDETAARAVKGVVDIVKLPYGVGVVADRPWNAFAARDALNVTWNREGKAWDHDSEKATNDYMAIAKDLSAPGAIPNETVGDAAGALAGAAFVLEAEYSCDLAYHAQMEPLSAVADVAPSGDSAEIWLGTQSQTIAVDSARTTLGIGPEKIKLHDMLVGGAYGRRGHREHEWLTDALLLSKAVEKPVKVIWTREDDIRNGRFRPQTAHYLRAGLDGKGKIVGWHHRVSADLTSAFQDSVRFARGKKDFLVAGGADEGGFDIPNRLTEVVSLDNGVRTSAWRGIGNGPNKYAIASFMDEIARHRGVDPVDFFLELVGKDERAQNVIHATAKMADWGSVTPGRAKGFTFVNYSQTLMGAVAEVSVDRKTGLIQVHNFWSVIDPGFAVQPENIKAQMTGGIIFALGSALSERITISDGAVQQSNFYDYILPRMDELPEIHVEVLSTPNAAPLGIGEQTVVTVAPAISNAVVAAIGKRIRYLPMTPDRVLDALKL